RHLLKAAPNQRHAVAERRVWLELLDEKARVRISRDDAHERPPVETGLTDQTVVAEPRIEPQSQHCPRAAVASGNGAGRSKDVGLYRSERRLKPDWRGRRRFSPIAASARGERKQQRRRRDLLTRIDAEMEDAS